MSAEKTRSTAPPSARRFELGPGLERALAVKPYEREPGDPVYRPLRIYSQDPTTPRLDGGVTVIQVPYEPLAPGPVGRLLEVVDHDASIDQTLEPIDLEANRTLISQGLKPSTGDPRFAQQMVYAICSRVYHTFRGALGRDPSWGFDRGEAPARLRIRPHAERDENAYYDPVAGELAFGYFRADSKSSGRNQPGGHVFTALSHDVVVHETTHALLDGLRPHFRYDSNPDVPAFHEGFSDVVAIFHHFTYRDIVERAIERDRGELGDELLVDVARQFGQTASFTEGGALRTAILGEEELGEAIRPPGLYDPATESHLLGSVLVSAVFEAFRVVYRRKVKDFLRLAQMAPGFRDRALPLELTHRLAREAGRLAEDFLNICIRALDYCPPVDLTFGEYLRALVTADHDLVPSDPWGYREAFVDAFRRRGVVVPGVGDLSEGALLWRPPETQLPRIEELAFSERRFAHDPGRTRDAEEVRRQARVLGEYVTRPEHRWYFGLDPEGSLEFRGDPLDPPRIESMRSVRRIGPDGQLAVDLVAEVVQRLKPRDGGEFWGGSTIIIGPRGEVRYAIVKGVSSQSRLAERREYRAARPSGAETDREFFRRLHGSVGQG